MQVNLNAMSLVDSAAAIDASMQLMPEAHEEDCPVKHGASISCVLPFVCCVPDDFKLTDGSNPPLWETKP